MAKRILVPYDGSPQSEEALEFALREHPGADVTVFHIIDPVEGSYSVRTGVPVASEEWYDRAREHAEDLFEQARDVADEHGTTLDTETAVGRPARLIVERAEEDGVDHVVMGSHGRSGVTRVLLGSVAEAVIRRSTVPVTVVR